jgi:hypothetical protein
VTFLFDHDVPEDSAYARQPPTVNVRSHIPGPAAPRSAHDTLGHEERVSRQSDRWTAEVLRKVLASRTVGPPRLQADQYHSLIRSRTYSRPSLLLIRVL